MLILRLLLVVAMTLSCGCDGGCAGITEVSALGREPNERETNTATAKRTRLGEMDVTFMVTADTHLGHAGMERLNAIAVDDMNSMEGRAFPAALGGAAGKPLGVLAAGDLTENGGEEEWDLFSAYYIERLKIPLFETWGNHDKHRGWYVRQRITERHGGIVYSLDWQDLHIVSLGEAPDHEDVAWLTRDLEKAGKEVGVVLFFHFPLEGPYTDNWFTSDYKDALVNALAGYRVIGIFHGHYHASGTYRWRGFDVYNVGSPKHGFSSFATVRVTDTTMTVASWNYERRAWWWWHQKPIFGAKGATQRHVPSGLVGGG